VKGGTARNSAPITTSDSAANDSKGDALLALGGARLWWLTASGGKRPSIRVKGVLRRGGTIVLGATRKQGRFPSFELLFSSPQYRALTGTTALAIRRSNLASSRP